jgi:hypothetical protein
MNQNADNDSEIELKWITFYDTYLTYDNAVEFCTQRGGTLASKKQYFSNNQLYPGGGNMETSPDRWAPISDKLHHWVFTSAKGPEK